MNSPLKYIIAGVWLAFCSPLSDAATTDKKPPTTSPQKTTHEMSFDDIIKSYTLIADFEIKAENREISEELFWKYPLTLPQPTFPYLDIDDYDTELPATHGEGDTAVQHINRGRILLLEGKTEEANKTWLGARARYGKTSQYHRRLDYLIGYSFLRHGYEQMKALKITNVRDEKVRQHFNNAATFLSWAFIVKKDIPDPLVEKVSPKGFYNLAAIYYASGRLAGAFGIATEGVNFLRRTGRAEFRGELRRLLAETHVQNRSYLEAFQEFDSTIRQNPKPLLASQMFARIADIYFDLNNYELAEDTYAIANRVDREMERITPLRFALRGESLFWLGRFDDAQKMFYLATTFAAGKSEAEPLSRDNAAYAMLRIADAHLARKSLEPAKLAYFKVTHEFPGSVPARIAKIRSACLELPFYQGNNTKHARNLLDTEKLSELIPQARELAWACHVGSFARNERTQSMVDRVREFYQKFPTSRFLESLIEPVREVQAGQIDKYFETGELYNAVAFFEAARKDLYPAVPKPLQSQLFAAYVDIQKPLPATEFYAAYKESPDTDFRALRFATFVAEISDIQKGTQWSKQNSEVARSLINRQWTEKPSPVVERFISRILATKSANTHLTWIYNLSKFMATSDPKYTCSLLFPLLSHHHIIGNQGMGQDKVKAELDLVAAANLPAMFEQDESCAVSLLDFELKVHSTAPEQLAQKYIKRSNWPLTSTLTEFFWTTSEMAYNSGARSEARQLWEIIKNKGPRDSIEVKLAASRLDPTQTEFEQLWQ